MPQALWLAAAGLVIGAYGTLIGAGGGFVLVPLLLLLYPAENSNTIATISLAVVFFNALSGTIAYARMRRGIRPVVTAPRTAPGTVATEKRTPDP